MNFPTKEVQTKPFRSRCKKVMCSRRSPTELYGGSIKKLALLVRGLGVRNMHRVYVDVQSHV